MRRITLRVSIAVLGLLLVAASADAQRRARRQFGGGDRATIGGHVGYSFDVQEALLGVQASFPIASRLAFYTSFDHYFVSGSTLWGLNFDLKVHPPTRYGFFYAGAGLNLLHTSTGTASYTNSNLGLFAGLEGRRGPIRPYAEARLIVGDGSAFQIAGGLNFTF